MVIAILVASLCSCGDASQQTLIQSKDQPHSTRPIGQSSPSTTDVAQSPKWAAEGRRLKEALAAMPTLPPISEAFEGRTLNHPYESIPIDILKGGSYTLSFGPISRDVKLLPPFAFRFDFPSDIQFQVTTTGPITPKVMNDQTFIEVPLTVSLFRHSYADFRAWIF
jgi:hypothetical protein